MNQIIEYFIGSIFMGSYFIYIGSKFLGYKLQKSIKLCFVTILLMLFLTFNYMILDNVLKSATAFLVLLILYRWLFNKTILQCAIASFLAHMPLAIGEVLFIVVISVLNFVGILNDITNLTGNIITNVIITMLALLIGLLLHKPVNKILNKINGYNKVTLVITFTLLLAAICSLFYKIYFNDVQFDTYLMFNLLLVITLTYIAYVVIKQNYDKIKLSDEYEKYVEYSKQSEKLVNQYSISQHENKNELIAIRSMVHRSNKKLLEYMDEIISSKDNIDDAWIRSLRYLPFGGLKGIIHNKISEMKEHGINVFLNISRSIKNSKLKDLKVKDNVHLLKIVGVFLDNAKEAAISSVEKEVSICVYLDLGKIVFEISNTYINDVDLSKIGNIGETTKGIGRGSGLALVKSIIDENKIFINETKKVDKYFVQILKINIKK